MVFIGLSFQDLGEWWCIFLVDKVNGNKRIHWPASYESGFALNRIANRCSEQSAFQWIGRVCQTQDFFSLCCDWGPGCCWLDGWRFLHLEFSTKNESETTYLIIIIIYKWTPPCFRWSGIYNIESLECYMPQSSYSMRHFRVLIRN